MFMNSIGYKISELRKVKGYTQEELAELSKINLRTIQRIENDKNEPRGKTLKLICDILEIDPSEFKSNSMNNNNKSVLYILLNIFFYLLLNMILMFVIGFLTLDSEANLNSRIGAFLLSIFIPFYIVYITKSMNPIERVLKFGSGYILYIIMLLFARGLILGFQIGFIRTGLFQCLIISIGVLFYGNYLLKEEK
jgi:transcriptional regulator with XRE-family HTH domain